MADAATQQQAVAAKDAEQHVAPHINPVITLEHDLEFATADAGMPLAYLPHQANDHIITNTLLHKTVLGLVLGLPCMAK